MQKFVIKNRKKRKYTKKILIVHSFSLGKALYEALPLLILIISFAATLFISASFRKFFSQVTFTFQLPNFSLQSLNNSFHQSVMTFKQGYLSLQDIIPLIQIHFLIVFRDSLYLLFAVVKLIDPQPVYLFFDKVVFSFINELKTALIYVFPYLSILLQTIAKTGFNLVFLFQYYLNNSLHTLELFFVSALKISIFFVLDLLSILSNVFIVIVQTLKGTCTIFIDVIGQVFFSFWNFLTILFNAVGNEFNRGVDTIIYLCSIPLKILLGYWIEIKPYLIILINHMSMTNKDFSNSVASFIKITQSITSNK